jgi:hypothetical protein
LIRNDIRDIDIFYVDGLPFPFGRDWRKVYVNLSGGADSACLTFTICELIKKNDLPCRVEIVSFDRCWFNRPWQPFISKKIYELLKSMYPDTIVGRNVGFVAPEMEHAAIGNIIGDLSASQIVTTSFNNYLSFYDGEVDAVFLGRTKNPDDLKDHPFRMEIRDHSAETGDEKNLIYREELTGCYFIKPFVFTEKDWIVKQYAEAGLWRLFEETRSCEGDLVKSPEKYAEVDFKREWKYDPSQKIAECGTCYWCAERKWAIDKYKKNKNWGQP